jgi:hypothetical protein
LTASGPLPAWLKNKTPNLTGYKSVIHADYFRNLRHIFGVESQYPYSRRIELRQPYALKDTPVFFHETMPLGEGIWAAQISSLWGNE